MNYALRVLVGGNKNGVSMVSIGYKSVFLVKALRKEMSPFLDISSPFYIFPFASIICSNLNIIVYNCVTFQWKGFALDSIEVTSFSEIEVDNPESIYIRLRNARAISVIARGEVEHLELIEFLMDMESDLIEEEELILCLVAPVLFKYTGVPPGLLIAAQR